MSKLFRFMLPILTVAFLTCLFTLSVYAGKVKSPEVTIPIEVSAYLTRYSVDGANVLAQCADGYHFASVIELQKLSPFVYNTILGRTGGMSDYGEGPPMGGWSGWVRTGFSELSPVGEEWNCLGWTSNNPSHKGVLAGFDFDQTLNAGVELKFQKLSCGSMTDVWCISDAAY